MSVDDFIALVMTLTTLLQLLPVVDAFDAFRSGEPWKDTQGDVIDAHGGGLLHDGGVFYCASMGLEPAPLARLLFQPS